MISDKFSAKNKKNPEQYTFFLLMWKKKAIPFDEDE